MWRKYLSMHKYKYLQVKPGTHTGWIWMLFVSAFLCKCLKYFFLCVSFRSNMIMTHTLTGFMELMDHGIVSWENLSSVFIKKVPLSVCLSLLVSSIIAGSSITIPIFAFFSFLFRSRASSTPSRPMHQYSRCPWTSSRAWCWAATASSCRSNRKLLWRGSSLTSRCK